MSTLSKQKQKYILSLHNKKYRHKNGQFIVEGRKSIQELMNSNWYVDELFVLEEYFDDFDFSRKGIATQAELEKISYYKSNSYGIALVDISKFSFDFNLKGWVLALDNVGDPGNLGTIIRIADWYGIEDIVCSPDCVDYTNPKTIASTMGSFTRVRIHYLDLGGFLKKVDCPVYGASMEGASVHRASSIQPGVLLMGSESHGISQEYENSISSFISIPSFGHTESLNVAVATGILLDNLRRLTT